MPGHCLILYHIDKLEPKKDILKTEDRRPRGSHNPNSTVSTEIKFTRKREGKYQKAYLTHRAPLSLTALWRGQPVNDLITVEQFPAYYKHNHKQHVFFIEAKRETARAAVRRLNRECAKEFRVTPLDLDLKAIFNSAKAPVVGAWCGNPKGKYVRSRGAFGEDLTKGELERMLADGKLSSIGMRYPLKDCGVIRANFSRHGSVLIFNEPNIRTRLRLVEHLLKLSYPQGLPDGGI